MKKSVTLFCTNPLLFLTELPLIILLYFAIKFNNGVTGLVKLYPLIVVICAGIIFLFVYFFRAIIISREEIKIIGRFSSRDRAIINKDKRLVLTLCTAGKLTVELFGNDGKAPELDWAQSDEEYLPMEINLFRERAFGSFGSARAVLRYFSVPEEDIARLLSEDIFTCECDGISVCSVKKENIRALELKFLKTL